MNRISYDAASVPVRADLAAAHQFAWDHLARPGTWLDGAMRLRVAAETRRARRCTLCMRRKAALSPFSVDGRHDDLGELPQPWVEVIHRIVTDAGRLTHAWYKRMLASGIAEGEYVEVVSLIAHVTAVDTFARALGMLQHPLPAAKEGAPSRYRPREARQHAAWVPTIAWGKQGPDEADLFIGTPSNVRMALTLVPGESRSFFGLSASQYLPGPAARDFSREYRAITHAQIELVAARVSAINQCMY